MRLNLAFITENYKKITIIVFLCLISVTLAAVTNNVISVFMDKDFEIKPSLNQARAGDTERFRMRRSIMYYSDITERNIFDSLNRKPEKKEEKEPEIKEKRSIYSGPPVKSSMNATLVGTMVFSNPSMSFAKIARSGSAKGGDTESFYIGDSLFGEATVRKINRNRVYIERNGRMEYLEIEGPSATVMPSVYRNRGSRSYNRPTRTKKEPSFSEEDVRSVGDNKFLINKEMLDKMLSNYNSILTQARAVPNFVDGKANGFKIFAIRRGSIYQAIGIKNGDVLTRVNGSEINNLEKVLSLFTQLRNESNISLDIVRGRKKQKIEYERR
jgi:general secretion pathway protein C